MLKKIFSSLNKVSTAALVLSFLLSSTVFAQSDELARERLNHSIEVFESSSFDEAGRLFKELANEYCNLSGYEEICFESQFHLSDIARHQGDLKEAAQQLEDLESYITEKFGADYQKLAQLYRKRLIIEEKSLDLDAASRWANKLREIAVNPESDLYSKAVSYAAIGYYDDSMGNYREAITNYMKSIELAEEINDLEKTGKLLIHARNNLGVSYRKTGEIELALEQFKINLELTRRVYGEQHIEMATAYNNIGTAYYMIQDIGRAVEYFTRTAGIIESIHGPGHKRLGAPLNNAGLCYYSLENYEKAAEYLERAQRVKESTLGKNHPETAIGYSNLASIHIQNEDFESAKQNYLRSISVRETNYGDNHPSLVDPKLQMGRLYLYHLNSPGKARGYFESALSTALDRLGESHPDVADANLLIGETHHSQERFDEALPYYRRSIKLLYGEFNLEDDPNMSRPVSDPVKLVRVLQLTSNLYKNRSSGFNEVNYRKALRALVWASEIVDDLQSSYQNEASKLRLVDQNYSLFTSAVEILAALYKETGDDRYKHQMFEFIEKSRSRVALELIQDLSARSFAGVPEEVIENEAVLNSHISRFQKLVYAEQKKGDERSRERLIELQDSVFTKKRELEQFIRELEQNYPVYYELKYDQSVVSLDKAQALLREEETLISYVMGSDQIYAMVISPKDVNIVSLGSSENITDDIEGVRREVIEGDIDDYITTAHGMYQKLFKPVEPFIAGTSVLIMADQIMHYLPFEVLLTDRPNHQSFYRMPYLLREYTISYIPSATLLNIMDERRPDNPRNLLAVAPFSSEIIRPEDVEGGVQYASTVGPLFLTKFETQTISGMFTEKRTWGEFFWPQKAKILAGLEATLEELSKIDLQEYSYVHFATHAFVNEEDPKYSGIMMRPEAGKSGIAYVSDIYNMDFNADLVVLGACETGLGAAYRGEGLIGFTRAFIHAGASNIAVSMWKVNDQATTYLMIDFYDYIREGDSYAGALRRAKLNIINKPHMADPVNWASFILIGR